MRFLALGNDEVGFLSFGQLATGVIAVGQLARGGIAIGQGAIGLIAIGQGALGVFYGTGMVGAAGRKGWGVVMPLIPSIGARRVPPETTTVDTIASGARVTGWVAASLGEDAAGFGLFDGGRRLPVKLDRSILSAAKALRSRPAVLPTIYAHTRVEGDRLVADRIVYVPERPYRTKGFLLLASLQVAALIGVGIGFWPAAGNDVIAAMHDSARAEPTHAAPAPHAPGKTPRRH